MADDLTVLESKDPEIARFLREWRSRYENRKFDFSVESDQADFCEAVFELTRHIAHVSQSARLATVMDISGISTLYLNVGPKNGRTSS